MAHTLADSQTRQQAVDSLYAAITELEGVVAEAESREGRRDALGRSQAEAAVRRFPAMGDRR